MRVATKYLVLYTIFILAVFGLVYLRIIPRELKAIPYYDSVGHFVLYGIWGYLFALAFSKSVFKSKRLYVPWGIVIVMGIAILEESLQYFSSVRSFSFFDMVWSLAGICVAWILVAKKHGRRERH